MKTGSADASAAGLWYLVDDAAVEDSAGVGPSEGLLRERLRENLSLILLNSSRGLAVSELARLGAAAAEGASEESDVLLRGLIQSNTPRLGLSLACPVLGGVCCCSGGVPAWA